MSKSPSRSKSSLTVDTLEEPISEQDEWVRNELTKLWGDDVADYFVNSKIDFFEANKQFQNEVQNVETNNNSSSIKLKKKQISGLYAHQIWKAIREESGVRLKPFDLNKELQSSMDAYVRNEVYNKNKRITKTVRSDEELLRNKNSLDMKRIKEIKSLRNEVELMYRSSKMNEEKFGVLRADSPLPDLNDKHGKEGIIRYLPPIDMKKTKFKSLRFDSKLEFITSPLMRDRYREKLEEKLAEEKNKVIDTLIENSVLNKQTEGYQPVRMVFLTEENAADPEWRASVLEHADNEKISTHVDRLAADSPKDENLDELKAKRAQVYPPLTLNALMEYKQTIHAPGVGDFKHGHPNMFKFPT